MNFAELIENLPESILSTRPKLDAPGRYNVKVIEASYGANQAKTGFRGVLKLEVLDGDKATATAVLTKESIEEIDNLLSSSSYYLDNKNKLAYSAFEK